MRLLCHFEGTQYIACGEVLIAVNPKITADLQQFEFPSGKGSQIIAVTVSLDGKFVYAGYANKHICCWSTTTRELLGSVLHSKRPTAIVYMESGTNQNSLVVSDKAGLIWGMDVPLFKKQVLLAGHTASVITDMVTNGIVIASADRDEKVRISNFPRMDTIQAFCMAHTNVVTSISFMEHDNEQILLSCGWDHRLCMWNSSNGKTYDVLQYDVPGSDSSSAGSSNSVSVSATANIVEAIAENITSSDPEGTSINAATAVDIDIDADVEGDAEGDATEKTYDEDSAGHYPVKIVASPNSSLVAVIFKNHSSVKIYNIKSNKSSKHGFGTEIIKELSAVPCDLCFTSSNELIVLLPKPFFMQIFSLEIIGDCESAIVEVNDFDDKLKIIEKFQDTCNNQGFEFTQQLVSTEDGVDAEKGTNFFFICDRRLFSRLFENSSLLSFLFLHFPAILF